MNSFYGGKEGRSYAIIKHFDTIDAMTTAFKQGGAYSEVNYGQYVIIDTISKLGNPNDPNNGKIYRRGLNYTANDGGAIYVGQIKGTDGSIPPMSFVTIDELNNITSNIIDEGNTFYQPSTRSSIIKNSDPEAELNYSTYNIQLGYKTYAEDSTGKNRHGAIGIDIPKPVVRVSAVIVQPSDASSFSHTDITEETPEEPAVDFKNPIHQASLSSSAVDTGVQYYDYQIAIPKAMANVKLTQSTDPQDNGAYLLQYDTISNGTPTTHTEETEIHVIDKILTNGDLLRYHLSGTTGTLPLGKPNGQFHFYDHITDQSFESQGTVINYLNSEYSYGIRTPSSTADIYDLELAGWIIAVDRVIDNVTKTSLYAFDYLTNNNSTYVFEQLKNETPDSVSPANSTNANRLKGWFKIQDFNSSLNSKPEKTILIGTPSSIQDYGNVTGTEEEKVQSKGIWLKSQNEEGKWWLT